ncbi:hypothetical protein AVEN_38730-1 [Araneus ventricosus]|uniref:Uncharacterized protein n=1 Tax=Araneus ventricosus TaxID=182803 RepID=A0A4Y2QL45_ARAVE|nr:hypothetical protein AVEN_38730-1 [Araneus ventricosus]
MGVAWGDTGAIRRMLQDLPSKFFKELKGLLGHMWPIVVLEEHFPIRELAPDLLLDDNLTETVICPDWPLLRAAYAQIPHKEVNPVIADGAVYEPYHHLCILQEKRDLAN